MPGIRRVLVAVIGLVAALLIARLCAQALPAPIGMVPAMTIALCLPGWALLRATGLAEVGDGIDTVALLPIAGPVVWLPALILGLALRLPFTWVMALVLFGSLAALVRPGPVPRMPVRRELVPVAAGAVLAAALATRWRVPLLGDSFFHAGRIRKLLDLPRISLSGVSAYKDGHPHAGYAVPLLHAVQAGAVKISGIDVATTYTAQVTFLAVFLVVAAFAAGRALGGPVVGAVAAALELWESVARGIRPISFTEQPGTYAFHLLLPGLVLLIALWYRDPGDRRLTWAVVAAVGVITVDHPTYAVPALAVLAGVVVFSRRGWRVLGAACAVSAVYVLWVWWVALRGGARAPVPPTADTFDFLGRHAVLMHADVVSSHTGEYLLGVAAVCGLLLYRRGRHALAATMAVGGLALVGVPGMTAFMVKLMGYGQVKRLGLGIPIVYPAAVAIGVVAGRARGWALAAIAAAIALASLALRDGGFPWSWPSLVTGALVVAALVAIAIAVVFWLRRWPIPAPPDVGAPLWAAVLLTVALLLGSVLTDRHAIARALDRGIAPARISHLTSPGVVEFFRTHSSGAHMPVVLAPYDTRRSVDVAFQLVGDAPVYVVALDPVRTRAEPLNHPQQRRDAVNAFFAASTDAERMAIVRRYGVDYVVVDATRRPDLVAALRASPSFRLVYQDRAVAPRYDRFAVFQPAAGSG